MKKISMLLLSVVMLFALSACSSNDTPATEGISVREESTETETNDTQGTAVSEDTSVSLETNRTLIVYFGRWGNTEYPEGIDASTSASIVPGEDGQLQGTTEYVAALIGKTLGGDLHAIQTVEPYPADYDAVVEQNRQEQADGYLPELQASDLNIEQYDTIYIGYPIWATTIPQPVVSFLNQYDFSGKTMIPFCTHAGYGSGDSYNRIQELCPDATVQDGLAIEAEQMGTAAQAIAEWISVLQSPTEVTEITITVGETVIRAELNDSEAAQEFASRLPLNVSMTRMGEHEYYGSLDEPLTHTEDLQTGYEVGDIAFWTPGDLLAVYFDEPDEAPEGLIILGAVISDMSVFSDMDSSVEMYIERIE